MALKYTATTQRLYIEPLTIDDHLKDFHELWTDAEAVKYTTRVPKTSIQETEKWMPTILNSKAQPEVDKWAVFLRPASDSSQSCLSETGCSDETGNEKKGTFIGIVGTNRWSEQGMETGYCLHKDHWGRGYATEAFEGFLRMYWTITERKDIPHLVAKVYPQNEQSVKVLRKCGGREGEMLGRETLKNGMGEVGDIQCWYFDRPVDGGGV